MIWIMLAFFAGSIFGFFIAMLLAVRAQSEQDHRDALARDQRIHEMYVRRAKELKP